MDLWIRTQDKKLLIPIKKMITNTCEGLFYDGIILGTYKTKQRALEVLDEIQSFLILGNDDFNEQGLCESYNNIVASKNTIIYEMPKE